MVFDTEKGKYAQNSVGSAEQFKIVENEKLFMLLSDSIYADKVAACIRELSCNAYDAHIESGVERPFQVFIPSSDKLEFRIRDFGTGLSPEQMSMYTTYGESTKTLSNAYIGAFGIGAKSPFAYTNTFNVSSFYKGKAYYYAMYVENGLPKMTLLGSGETDLPSGLEVSFAVKESDIDEFQLKASKILIHMKDRVEVLNADSYWERTFYERAIDWQPASYLGASFYEDKLRVTEDPVNIVFQVVQGNVEYSVSSAECEEAFLAYEDEDTTSFYKVRKSLPRKVYFKGRIKVPNGTFMPQPSRERLSFTPETKKKLGAILYSVYCEKVIGEINKAFRQAQNSYARLFCALKDKDSIVKDNVRFRNLFFKGYKNTNYDSWLTRSVIGLKTIVLKENVSQVAAVKSVNVKHVLSQGIPVFYQKEGTVLSFEKKCRIIQYFSNRTDFKTGEMAYVVNSIAAPLFSENDLASFITIEDLPTLPMASREAWKSPVASGSRAKFTVVFMNKAYNVDRIETLFKDPDSLTEKERKYTFWVDSDKAWALQFSNRNYDFYMMKDRRAFIETYTPVCRLINACYNKLYSEEFYGTVRVVLLPKGSPLRNCIKEFGSVVQEVLRHAVDNFEKNFKYDWRYYSARYYASFIEDLIHSKVFEQIGLPSTTVKKYLEWYLLPDRQNLCRTHSELFSMAWAVQDQQLAAKITQIRQDLDSGVYVLDPEKEIVRELANRFPLVKCVSEYNLKDPALRAEVIDYIRFRLADTASEEKTA